MPKFIELREHNAQGNPVKTRIINTHAIVELEDVTQVGGEAMTKVHLANGTSVNVAKSVRVLRDDIRSLAT